MRLRAAAHPKITISYIRLKTGNRRHYCGKRVPGTLASNSALAAIVIRTTQQAVAALSAASGQPIHPRPSQPSQPL